MDDSNHVKNPRGHVIIHVTMLIYTNDMPQPNPTNSNDTGPDPLHPERLTWAVLLGQWVEFARSAVGLPVDDEGLRMRDSVADIIMLQAVWFALQHMQELADAERAVGLDRAGVLIEKHEKALQQRWGGNMPASMHELIAEARAAYTTACG